MAVLLLRFAMAAVTYVDASSYGTPTGVRKTQKMQNETG